MQYDKAERTWALESVLLFASCMIYLSLSFLICKLGIVGIKNKSTS